MLQAIHDHLALGGIGADKLVRPKGEALLPAPEEKEITSRFLGSVMANSGKFRSVFSASSSIHFPSNENNHKRINR